MNIRPHPGCGGDRRGRRAFTLPELMVTTAIFMLVIGGVVASNLFGMRMFTLTQTKLGNSDISRRTIDLLIADVRSVKKVQVGAGTFTSFAESAVNTVQQGNAVQLYPTTATNTFIRYYWDTTDQNLKRTTNGASAPVVVGYAVSNSLVFTREDFSGNILSNNQSHSVIGVTLQFSQLLFPPVNIGPTSYYDFYQLQAKITRRTQE
jgi:type II secretory pathway pseudopilin PulG